MNVYLPEREVLPPLDEWLMLAFAPHRLTASIEAMYDAQPAEDTDSARAPARGVVAECDRKIARYREALDAGADPVLVTGWIAEVQARRAEAEAQLSQAAHATRRMSREQIRSLVETISSVRDVLARAEPSDKAGAYKQLGLRLTYQPGPRIVRAEATSNSVGARVCVRGGT